MHFNEILLPLLPLTMTIIGLITFVNRCTTYLRFMKNFENFIEYIRNWYQYLYNFVYHYLLLIALKRKVILLCRLNLYFVTMCWDYFLSLLSWWIFTTISLLHDIYFFIILSVCPISFLHFTFYNYAVTNKHCYMNIVYSVWLDHTIIITFYIHLVTSSTTFSIISVLDS